MAKIEQQKPKSTLFFNDDDVVLKVNRQLETRKSTTSLFQTVDLLYTKSSISKPEIVDFDE